MVKLLERKRRKTGKREILLNTEGSDSYHMKKTCKYAFFDIETKDGNL